MSSNRRRRGRPRHARAASSPRRVMCSATEERPMAPERSARSRMGPANRAAVTLVALCLTTTLGIALASYLALSNRSAQLSNRLINLDKAQQLAQTGLEEALWALNQ